MEIGELVALALDGLAQIICNSRVGVHIDRHPRWTFHLTPTSYSWANAVEGWFAKRT